MVTGLFLFLGDKLGLLNSWPRSRLVAYLGRTSYSLFLIHFPVLVVVETAWARLGRTSPWDAVAGLCVAYVASLVAAALLYAAVEAPAATLSRRFS
jgi:peptidoglycan/LPS O-acetylase OafA/YrhL